MNDSTIQAPPPLLILCPMRSFSSIVCGMIGSHPQLYGLPEVNLFIADTVDELLSSHARRPIGMHGLLRALAQIEYGEQTESTVAAAQEWLEQRRDWGTQDVYDHLRAGVAPRIVVDKTPRTVLASASLERAYAMFPDASFLHLTRHPRSNGKSQYAHIQRNSEWGGTANADRVDPETIWLRAHSNIIEFASTLPEGQCLRIKGEALLSDPELYLPQIAEWLGVDTGEDAINAMLHPETSPFACYGPENAKYGNDQEFLENPAFRRREVQEPPLFGPLEWSGEEFRKETIKVSRELGYA
jgi:hypothetical protein